MFKILKYTTGIILAGLAIFGLYQLVGILDRSNEDEEISSVIMLERVEKVFKLTTVEGHFSEIYNYRHHIFADIWPFRKQALIRVNAKVSVGFNLENIHFIVDEDQKTFTIDGPVVPEILSIEHDLDYYNFENGLFNVLTNKDITDMSARAKEFIEEKAIESSLFDEAEAQKKDLIDLLSFALVSGGWELHVANQVVDPERMMSGGIPSTK